MYRSTVLELLRQRKELAYNLKINGTLLSTINSLADRMKAIHEDWKVQLAQANPGTDESQIANLAMEYAIKEIEDGLPDSNSDSGELSLDGAMAYLKRQNPPA